jgi:hypothetical protein
MKPPLFFLSGVLGASRPKNTTRSHFIKKMMGIIFQEVISDENDFIEL